MRYVGFMAVAALTVFGCARGPNITTGQLPLTRVVVYRNGVGYFERSGHVDESQVTFKMRQRMVGDFLATLAIVEQGGSSVRSASFPLELPEDEQKPQPDARLQSMLKPFPEPTPEPKDPGEKLRKVVLRLDGSEHDLVVGYVAETPVWRPSYRLVVQDKGADLQAWGIVQNLSGEDWDNVKLALVAGAPLAFQSTLGEPVIPERPIVTDTGEVINAVPESETSLKETDKGAVDRVGDEEANKKKAEAPQGSGNAPTGDSTTVAGLRGYAGGGAGRGRPAKVASRSTRHAAADQAQAPPPPEAGPGLPPSAARRIALEKARERGPSGPRNLRALAAVAVETGSTRYEIPNPITVPDKSATMVLLVSHYVPGGAVFLFAPDGGVPDSSSHPFRVARFTNTTKGLLERGPIAVFEKGSFLGQGMVDPLPPGATATVPFALERSLAVESDRKYDQAGARVHHIESGELTIERDQVTRTIYKIKNGSDDKARVLVKHPRIHGARLYNPPTGTEDNTGTGSALIPVDVRPHGRTELTVDERQSTQQGVSWLSPLADTAVKGYLKDPRADQNIAGRLAAAWVLRDKLKKSVDEMKALGDEQDELEKETRETRLSLRAIEKNKQAADLRAKLTRRLSDATTRLEQITKRMIELKMAINEQQVRFRDAIHDIKLEKPLPPKP